MNNIEHLLNTYSLYLLCFGAILLAVLAFISLRIKHLEPETKKLLFGAIVIATLVPTAVMSASTVYLNTVSSSKGPVHWHADIEIWACGREIDLKDPKGISNKIGTSTLHEHNDKRIHLEGLVMDAKDASLSNFFHVIGGDLTTTSLSIPTNEGVMSVRDGLNCGTQELGELGEVQVYVYQTDKDNYYSQKKILDPATYVISPSGTVPPADCVIVEYGPVKERTDKMCRSYKVALEIGKLKGEKENGY